jgi:chemotaxis protein methyltransferase CheR
VSYSSPADNLIRDADYLALKHHVIESTGLAYYADKDPDFAARISVRMSELRLQYCSEYLKLLKDSQKGESERHLLIAQLTIGETYFFRHAEQFDALRDVVFPDILRRNADARRLRIWCAGCSTGAEPYSVAILLKQEFSHRLVDWDVQIIATDINQAFLARAQHGRYEEWAMRSTPETLRRRWFAQEGKSWVLAAECREWVTFQYHNLVEHPFPSLLHNIVALDLIMCRNVMIYFDRGVIRTIVGKFHDCLVDDGWLIVGHAEANVESFQSYETVNAPGTTLYRKGTKRVGAPIETGWKATQDPQGQSPLNDFLPAWKPPDLPDVKMPPGAIRQPEASNNIITSIRKLADEGKWMEAIEQCDQLLRTDSLNYSIHFYRALILEQLGRIADSEQSLRKSIYLDRQFPLAHYHLGLLLQKTGEKRAAIQSMKNAQRILHGMDKTFIFEEADGMTVMELEELVEMQMQLLSK